MASGFDREEFERLREYVEGLSISEKEKSKFLKEEWKRICEAQVNGRNVKLNVKLNVGGRNARRMSVKRNANKKNVKLREGSS